MPDGPLPQGKARLTPPVSRLWPMHRFRPPQYKRIVMAGPRSRESQLNKEIG